MPVRPVGGQIEDQVADQVADQDGGMTAGMAGGMMLRNLRRKGGVSRSGRAAQRLRALVAKVETAPKWV